MKYRPNLSLWVGDKADSYLPFRWLKQVEDEFSSKNRKRLKQELDHWNVYSEYEDKFLDLFRSKDRKKEAH